MRHFADVELLAVKSPDLVLLDMMMPVMGGFAFIEKLPQTATGKIMRRELVVPG